MKRILVTGALGQIGTELVPALRALPGVELVVASDIRVRPVRELESGETSELLDVTNLHQLRKAVQRNRIDTIYHLAALLSAVAEDRPQVAWDINMGGLYRVLEVAREQGCKLFFPSSIGAFGPGTPKDLAPQDTLQRPTTMYGVTKVAGELLGDYYWHRFRVDVRGVRYPGLISHVAMPGGGTTDYAVEIFYAALRHGRYTCFLRPDTRMDMMYMPDAVAASIGVMVPSPEDLLHRNAFNVTAMSFTPEELAAAIRVHLPSFTIDYEVDPIRQAIADSWPDHLDDSAARSEWGWEPRYDLATTTADMLEKLDAKLTARRSAGRAEGRDAT